MALVELIRRATLLEEKNLLELLLAADDGMGLGSSVLDVRAEVSESSTPGSASPKATPRPSTLKPNQTPSPAPAPEAPTGSHSGRCSFQLY